VSVLNWWLVVVVVSTIYNILAIILIEQEYPKFKWGSNDPERFKTLNCNLDSLIQKYGRYEIHLNNPQI